MARSKGTFNFAANFEVLAKAPLDARMVVDNYTDLILPATWEDGDSNIWLFDGAIVSVASDPSAGIYFLADADNYSDYSNWILAGTGASGDASIGVLNIGSGEGNVFAGFDSSGNITLKTISSSEGILVTESADQIFISLDPSYTGTTTATNIGTGDASLFAQKTDNELEFRTLKGTENILVNVSDNIVIIDTSANFNDIYTNLDGKLDVSGGTITGDLTIDGSLEVGGPAYFGADIFVDGSLFVRSVEAIDVSGAFIVLNTGQTGIPSPFMQSGIVVDRGDLEPYVFLYDESTQTFRIGIAEPDSSVSFDDASTQAVATREDIPIDKAIAVWNDALQRFDTSAGLIFDETGLYVDGSVKISKLAGSDVRFVTALPDGTLDVSTMPLFVRESSIGDTLYFDASGFLQVDVSAIGSGNYDTTLDPGLEMPTTVGGYPAGTLVSDLSGDSLIEMWDNLLFPTVEPTFVAPSNPFGVAPSTSLYEVNELTNLTFTSTLDKGAINISGSFQDYRSGDASLYDYTDPSSNTLLVDVATAALSDVQVINNYIALIGTQTFTSTVSYLEGPQPQDNKGNDTGSPLPAGTLSASSISFEGVYPLFGTTSSITVDTKQTLVSMLSANNVVFSLVAETGGNKQSFEIPDAWLTAPTNRPLLGIETFNTVAGAWEYQGGSAGASLSSWTVSNSTKTIQGIPGVGYKRYTYNGTDRSAIQIRLKF